jgi:hypothetical protein
MKSRKTLWMPMLLGMLLMATMAGLASARPNARPLGQAWRVLTIPTQACIPKNDDIDYNHTTDYVECDTGTCWWVCPADFPAAGEQAVGAVNVKRLTYYCYDNDASQYAWAWLRKTHPPSGAHQIMAGVQSAESADDPQTVMDTTIENNPIYRVQGPYIWLKMEGSLIRVYGIFIHYTW